MPMLEKVIGGYQYSATAGVLETEYSYQLYRKVGAEKIVLCQSTEFEENQKSPFLDLSYRDGSTGYSGKERCLNSLLANITKISEGAK